MTIESFSIEYDAINSRNTFTNGDTISGRIILQVSMETKIQSLIFVGKGKARVVWHEYYGQHQHRVYWANEKYYDVKQPILRETSQDGTAVLSKGRHVFPFSFKIPDRKMPSTFKHSTGRIVHKLRAELKQSMKLTKKTKAHFTFVSKNDMEYPGLMEPQYGCKDKSLSFFGSGTITMDVHTKRMGYKQGGSVKATVEIVNNSSRDVKPKFILYEKQSFFAQGHRKLYTTEILKEKSEAVAPAEKKVLTKVIPIPRELPPSILNCSIIKLEYRLKVYLDIKCASDPHIKLPIIILSHFSEAQMQSLSTNTAFEDFPNPSTQAWNNMPQPLDPPPSYSYAMASSSTYPDKHSSLM
ncbi:arrestin domain-containing protein 3-like [Cynoglossus semilaevis]|uniref:Arrestin domain-containing protein 3-like n=1 Tax=Cynoglossus semilaevis TaxID=244447 RepID=A0A3P8W2T9_CYNSE|nr:arrestin domain-containing protein 3-like [Cynoglossus semilaevis]